MAEWSDYNFSAGPDKWDSAPLKRVFHIAHIRHALQILEEGRILARPVYDESRLNRSRVHVVWLSPNDWINGSFYGNVRFHFNWEELILGKQIYWVEAIKYSPHAPRFIITDGGDPRVLTIDLHVRKYDPTADNGPLKKVGTDWFWNTKITLELMLEQSLNLDRCVRADIVAHHPTICRIHKGTCEEVQRDELEPGAELLGYLIGAECHKIDGALTSDIGSPNSPRYHNDLMFPVTWLHGKLSNEADFTGPVKSKKDAKNLIRAASLQLAFGQRDRAKAVMSLIASRNIADQAFEAVIQKHFGLQGVRVLLR